MQITKNKIKIERIVLSLAILEFFLILLFFSFFSSSVSGGLGAPNATVRTNLTVAKVTPEVLNVTINAGNPINLTANSTKTVDCVGIVRDWDNESDIMNVTAVFFDANNASYSDADDNNEHYINNSCTLNVSYGDIYLVNATCTFQVQYYANPTTWNCTMVVTDNSSKVGNNSNNNTISELLALGLPDFIEYGTVNSTYVSQEQVANVTNLGNVKIDLNLNGYANVTNDGYAMNCSRGTLRYINIIYEKYNLTSSNTGDLSLSGTESTYRNLTAAAALNQFDLEYRFNDSANEAINSTYWRIYVPLGVAGTCEGNIIFGAVRG